MVPGYRSGIRVVLGLVVFALTAITAAVPAAATTAQLPVPRVTLYPGDTIGDEHLVERLFDAGAARRSPVYVSREGLVGKIARRTLLPGQPVPLNAVREAHVVTQGKPALIVYKAEGLTITGLGIALQSAGVGDIVSLRNADTGTVIRGVVEPDGSIRVGAP